MFVIAYLAPQWQCHVLNENDVHVKVEGEKKEKGKKTYISFLRCGFYYFSMKI